MEGDSVLSKILPGGAAEQAGKLGEGMTNKPLDNSKLYTRDLMEDISCEKHQLLLLIINSS